MANIFALDGATLVKASGIGIPNATAITISGGKLYYALQTNNATQLYSAPGMTTTGAIPLLKAPVAGLVTSLCIKDNQVYYNLGKQICRVSALGMQEVVAGTLTGSLTTTPVFSALLGTFGSIGHIVYDSVERLFYFTDPVQGALFSMNADGTVARIFTGSGNYRMTIEKTSIKLFAVIPGIQGLALAPDGTLYASAHDAPHCILRFVKSYDETGAITFDVTPYAGYSTNTLSANGAPAIYSTVNFGTTGMSVIRMSMAVDPDGKLYFLETGTGSIKRINPETKNTFFKGFTGTLRHAPIQVIGNATIETFTTLETGSASFGTSPQNAISTTLYTTDMDTDVQGNVYFCDQKQKTLYKLDSANKLTNLSPDLGELFIQACVVQNTSVAAFTDTKGYLITIGTRTRTQSSLTFSGLSACCAHPLGWIFVLEGGTLSYLDSTMTTKTQLLTGLVPTSQPNQLCSMTIDPDGGFLYLSTYTTTSESSIRRIQLTATITGITAGAISFVGSVLRISSIFFSQRDKLLYAAQAPRRAGVTVTNTIQNRILTIDPATGVTKPFIGSSRSGAPIDGATIAGTTLQCPEAVCVDRQGNVYLADARPYTTDDIISARNSVLVKAPSKFFMRESYIYALAGTGVRGFSGDDGPAPLAQFNSPCGLGADRDGNLYVADSGNHCVRRIDAITETVTRFAGTGVAATSIQVDGNQANGFPLLNPIDVKVSPTGVVYIADKTFSIRRVTPTANGTQIVTYVGVPVITRPTPLTTPPSTGAIANTTPIGDVVAMCIDTQSTLYVATQAPNCIFTVDTMNRIRLIANLSFAPAGLAINTSRTTLFVTNASGNTVSSVNVSTGSISALPLTRLNSPRGIVCDTKGILYIANSGSNTITKYDPAATPAESIYLGATDAADFADSTTIVAGIRDGLPLKDARLLSPFYMFMNAYGRIFFTEGGANSQSHRIRTIPTDSLLDPCALKARYLRVEAASPGREIGITTIQLFTKDGTSAIPSAKLPTANSANSSAFTDFGGDFLISYITVIGTASTIDAKIYLYNADKEIISVRVLGPECVRPVGQTILYAVPWSQGCAIPAFIPVRTPCGITGVTSMTIASPTDSFDSYIAVYLDASGAMQTTGRQVGLTFTPSGSIEFLGVFIYSKPLASLLQTQVTLSTGTTTFKKTIQATSPTNTRFEFVDFRVSSSDYGCATLDNIYKAATGFFRVRYVRIIERPYWLSDICILSAETGQNLAAGLDAYTSSGTILRNLTTGTQSATSDIQGNYDWIEIDLGNAYVIEQIIISPSIGQVYNYNVKAYTERRDEVPLPTSATNPLSKNTRTLFMHNSALEGQFLQAQRIEAKHYGGVNVLGPTTATATAHSSWNNTNVNNILSGNGYHSQGTFQDEWLNITFQQDYRIAELIHFNRTDCCQSRQYSNTIIQLNALGFPLQRNALLGHLVDGTNYTQRFVDTLTNQFAIPVPRSLSGFSTGVPGVRYVRYQNTRATFIQISQLVVRDVAGVNRALNRSTINASPLGSYANYIGSITAPTNGQMYPSAISMYHNAWEDAAGFFEIDLGGTYEIDHVVYYGRGAVCNENKNVNWEAYNPTSTNIFQQDPNGRAAGAQIQLLGADRQQLAVQSLVGFLRRESLDFRPEVTPRQSMRMRYLRIEQPGIILSNATWTNFTTNPPGIELKSVKVYDIYNRNVAIGKLVSALNYDGSTPSGHYGPLQGISYSPHYSPGSYWELDLGQEYSIYKIELEVSTSQDASVYTNTPVILYDDDKQPLKRLYLTSRTNSTYSLRIGATNLEGVQPTFTPGATGRRVRLIELRGSSAQMKIRQVVAIDRNGINVAMGKPTISSDPPERVGASSAATYSNPAYNAINGIGDAVFRNQQTTYTTGDTTTFVPYLMIDLGGEYALTSIHLWDTENVSSIRLYTNDGTLLTTYTQSMNGAKTVIPIDIAGPQQCFPAVGRRARYIRFSKEYMGSVDWSNLCINSQFVVIDSLGRNVILNKTPFVSTNFITNRNSATSAAGTALTNGKYKASIINDTAYHSKWGSGFPNTNFIEYDLGAEYLITDIIVYASLYLSFQSNGSSQPSANYDVTLRDLYQHETFRGRVSDKNNHVNIMLNPGIIKADPTGNCPANTETINNICYGSCGAGEANGTQCLTACNSYDTVNPSNRTQCLTCPPGSSYATTGTNTGQCMSSCPSGFTQFDDTRCIPVCPVDSDGNIQSFNINTGMCETVAFPKSARVNVIRWTGSSAVFEFEAWTNNSGITYYWDSWFYSDKSQGRARRIYSTARAISQRTVVTKSQVTARPTSSRPTVPKVSALSSTSPEYKLYTDIGNSVGYTNFLDWNARSNMSVASWPTNYRWDVHRAFNNPAYVLGRSMAEVLNVIGTMTPYNWNTSQPSFYPYQNYSGSVIIDTTPSSTIFPNIPVRPTMVCPPGFVENPNATGANDACTTNLCYGTVDFFEQDRVTLRTDTLSSLDSNDKAKCYKPCAPRNGVNYYATRSDPSQCVADCPSRVSGLTMTDTQCIPPRCNSDEVEVARNGVTQCLKCEGTDPNGFKYVYNRAASLQVFDSQCYAAKRPDALRDYGINDILRHYREWGKRDPSLAGYLGNLPNKGTLEPGCEFKCVTEPPPNIAFKVIAWFSKINKTPDRLYWGPTTVDSIIQDWDWDIYPNNGIDGYFRDKVDNKYVSLDFNNTSRVRQIYTKEPSFRTPTQPFNRQPNYTRDFDTVTYTAKVVP